MNIPPSSYNFYIYMSEFYSYMRYTPDKVNVAFPLTKQQTHSMCIQRTCVWLRNSPVILRYPYYFRGMFFLKIAEVVRFVPFMRKSRTRLLSASLQRNQVYQNKHINRLIRFVRFSTASSLGSIFIPNKHYIRLHGSRSFNKTASC